MFLVQVREMIVRFACASATEQLHSVSEDQFSTQNTDTGAIGNVKL